MYKRKKKSKSAGNRAKIIMWLGILILIAITITGFVKSGKKKKIEATKPNIDVELLTVNPYSRPGIKNEGVKGIVIHYTANPGSTAEQNRDYFEGLKDTHTTKVSSHFVIGLEGEIVQCVPLNEISYASNDRNVDTIAIECCHPDDSGKFNEKTYESVVKLSGWLCEKYNLPEDAIIRHYDVTGKLCPKYYVEHEDEWLQLRKDIFNRKEEIEEMKKEDGFFKK